MDSKFRRLMSTNSLTAERSKRSQRQMAQIAHLIRHAQKQPKKVQVRVSHNLQRKKSVLESTWQRKAARSKNIQFYFMFELTLSLIAEAILFLLVYSSWMDKLTEPQINEFVDIDFLMIILIALLFVALYYCKKRYRSYARYYKRRIAIIDIIQNSNQSKREASK